MKFILARSLTWFINPIVYFAIALGIVLVSLKQIEFAIWSGQSSGLLLSTILAVIFMMLGIFFYIFTRPAKVNNFISEEISELSERELEILVLVSKGHSNLEIAGMLYISLPTVKSHVDIPVHVDPLSRI